MRYKTLLFDLDGTLLNTITDLKNAVNHALSLHGYPTHGEAAILHMVGNGIAVLMERALPGGRENPAFSQVLADFRAYYEVHGTDNTVPYDGILPMLNHLAAEGATLAILSNKIDPAVKALSSRFFGSVITLAFGEREGVARKPAPDAVFAALRDLGAVIGDAVMIGDSEVDLETARNAGIPGLSVGWGFRTPAELCAHGADRVFMTPAELTEYLLK